MRYFSVAQIQQSIRHLRPFNAILGTTFFVMKKEKIPIGRKVRFGLDAANRDFLEKHYRIHPKSAYFFRVLRQGNPKKDWNKPDYAGKGLQSVNTRGFPDAFLHDRNDNTWGWSRDYLRALAEKLPRGIRLPLFDMAVWLYKMNQWPDDITREKAVKQIINDYQITSKELEVLFQTEILSSLSEDDSFAQLPAKWHQILAGYSTPKDVPPEGSGILTYLETSWIGAVDQLRVEPARRLNLFTGDNGLGKTFLLDLAWWALTQDWADRPAWPKHPKHLTKAAIKFVVSGTGEARPVRAKLAADSWQWVLLDKRPAISGLVIYARVDGSFAIWDPANRNLSAAEGNWPGVKLSREEIWNGKQGQIEGLIRDVVRWQQRPDRHSAFETFKAVLAKVSPPDLGVLELGEPQRVPRDVREIPTLKHRYGTVPILNASAGVKRIVILAYLIVWAWEEHKTQAKQAGKREERQMVIILDEAEAHLHPKWQRMILPALLEIGSDLHAEMAMQLLVATHSPLVLASSEPVFDPAQDRLFHLDISTSGRVSFKELD
jgi:hypothetical protein